MIPIALRCSCSARSAMSSSRRFSRTSGGGMSASQRWHVVLITQLTLPQLLHAQFPSTPSLGAPLGHLADGAWPDWMAQILSSRMCWGGFGVEQRWQESRVPKFTFLQPVHRHAPSTPSCGAPLFCSAGLVRLTRRPRFGSHVHFSLSSSTPLLIPLFDALRCAASRRRDAAASRAAEGEGTSGRVCVPVN